MKRFWPFLAAVFVLPICAISGHAGTISYVGIPATQSDSNCGISRDHGYTTAVDGGNSRGTDRTINGITLYGLSGAGQNTATGDNCTLNALSGTLTDGGLTSKNITADGTMRDVLSDMVFNNAGGDNSQIEIVLDPESLDEGATYDLRVYICSSSGQNRQVNLQFFGDGQNGVETGFFNEDDARTSAGRFQNANQVYYINYRYTWDGDSTPGITITQKFGGAPFCLYALTNELVSDVDATAAGVATGGAGPETEEAVEGEGLSTGFVQQESDEIGVESDDFYGSESLNAHGRWVKLEKWGTCWQPTDVSNGWAPYTNGSWKECDDCGWTFVSDEPWAWACYHYGRWAKVGIGCGWAWVPGTVWAPSWVSWRQGKDETSIGWAPLPPEAGCRFGVGISSWVDSTCNIGPEYYTFINIRDFGSDSYFGCGCIYERARNVTIIIDTFNCTNIYYGRYVNIYCGGPDYNWCNTRIRQLGGKECGKIYVNRYDNPERLGGKFARREGEQLGLVSPRIHGTKNPKMRPKIAESAGADKIDHGWKGIKDKKQEQLVRRHIAQESKGKTPRNTKAKLPDGVAEKAAQHQGRRGQGAGEAAQGGGGGNLKPGGKGHRQAQGENVQGQTQGGAAGTPGDQHPGKRRRGAQGQAAAAGAAGSAGGAATQGSGFDQHPGKNRGRHQGGKGATGTTDVAGGSGAAGTQQAGGGRGPRHPGQSSGKKRGAQAGSPTETGPVTQGAGGSQTDTGAATGQEQGGGGGRGKNKRRGHQQNASTGQTEGGQQPQMQGAEGQGGQSAAGGGSAAGGSGRKGRRRQQSQQEQQTPQGQGQTQTASQGGGSSGGSGGGGGQGKGRRRQQQSTQQDGAQGQGSGGQGQHHQRQLQQQQLQQQQQAQQQEQAQRRQQMQQQHAQQQQYQQQQQQQQQQHGGGQGQGGGGGGHGKRGRPTPTPPPR